MDVSLLAMDLDGTTLQDDRKSFSPRLRSALAEAARRGVAIVPVTGRQYAMLPPAVHTGAAWEDLCVLCNGGEIRRLRSGESLAAYYIETDAALHLLAAAQRLGLPVEFSSGGQLYLTQESWNLQKQHVPYLQFHLDNILAAHGQVTDRLEETLKQPELRLDKINLPYVPETLRAEMADILSALPVSFSWSAPHSVEVTHREATKAQGMLRVCRMLGIDPVRTMAIGDGGNDIPMLRAAGLGIAMGSAPPEVREAADAVTAANTEDGAALAIERYILGRQ